DRSQLLQVSPGHTDRTGVPGRRFRNESSKRQAPITPRSGRRPGQGRAEANQVEEIRACAGDMRATSRSSREARVRSLSQVAGLGAPYCPLWNRFWADDPSGEQGYKFGQCSATKPI